jgi:hypothetical protein
MPRRLFLFCWWLVHLAFLVGVVVFAHHPPIFMGLFLFFLGITHAYEHHQDRLILKEGLVGGILPGRAGRAGWPAAVVAAATI